MTEIDSVKLIPKKPKQSCAISLLMDLRIGSVACVKQCGGNQHKGEECHP